MRAQRLLALFALGAALLDFPLLGLWDHADVTLFGLPLLPAAVFGGWAVLIGAAAWLVEGAADDDDEGEA